MNPPLAIGEAHEPHCSVCWDEGTRGRALNAVVWNKVIGDDVPPKPSRGLEHAEDQDSEPRV